MRRGSHDMQVNVAGIRRNLKNFAHNYSDAQKKVREATSNDPWGPSSTLMAEVADLTYNVVAFSEIMQMIWKRLNDHGRNWRHVYKALVLLEYLIKTGSEKVGQQCKENIFAIQTLKDFQYLEEGKDQGQNVREKAKQLVNLLKDDDRLKNERTRALKAKERFAQSASGFGSDGGFDTPSSPRYPAFRGDWSSSSRESAELPREIENARPQTAGEEELQLQLALAMSREEAEQEEQKRKSDDVRLQLALSQSQQDFRITDDIQNSNQVVNLLDVSLSEATSTSADPWGIPQLGRQSNQNANNAQWRSGAQSVESRNGSDPWQQKAKDPWLNNTTPTDDQGISRTTTSQDPWSPTSQDSSTDLDEFDLITNRNRLKSPSQTDHERLNDLINNEGFSNHTNLPVASSDLILENGLGDIPTNNNINAITNSSDPFEFSILNDELMSSTTTSCVIKKNDIESYNKNLLKKTPQSFLGENSSLVNLDNLVTPKPTVNPFADQQPQRPSFNTQVPKPTINEIKQATLAPFTTMSAPGGTNTSNTIPHMGPVKQDPWAPVSNAGIPPLHVMSSTSDRSVSNVTNNQNANWSNQPSATDTINPFLS